MYTSLKSEGHSFNFEDTYKNGASGTTAQNEDDDLAAAIALSLKESGRSATSKATSQSNLYPSAYPSLSTASTSNHKEPRKVRTLYDFEAAEDNELTFKAGEIISVLDDSDPNWWKGSSYRGDGLFPANFVTADLTAEPESDSYTYKSRKSVHFREEVEVKVMEPALPVLEIDEARIDAALALIQNADPTGEIQADSDELLRLEDQCKEMGPLIDQELEKIDRQHNSLIDYNTKLMEAFQLYNSLMSELPSYGYVAASTPAMSQPQLPPSNMYGGQQFGQGPQGFPPAMHAPAPGQPALPQTGYTGSPQLPSRVNHSPYHQLHHPQPDNLQQPYGAQNIAPPAPAAYSQQYTSYSSSTGYSVNPSYSDLQQGGVAMGGVAPGQLMQQQPVPAQSLL